MYLVGLTGGIASGKSVVAERFVHHGMELIDADVIAQDLSQPGTETHRKLVEHFGSAILDEDGFVDRPELGRMVFRQPDKRTLLNELTHPPIIEEIARQMELLQAFDGCVVIDVPLLVETGTDRGYESVVVVATTPETQVRRLVEQRGFSEADARARVEAQAPLEAKLAVATDVIWNEGSLAQLEQRADEVAEDLLRRARTKVADELDGVPDT